MKIFSTVITALAFFLLASPQGAWAQGMSEAIAGQNLRGYTHMFIAYAIAWLLVAGWVISIARRLGRVERELNR